MRNILLILLIGLAEIGFCQSITESAAKEDLGFLVEKIEEFNPALYKYNPDFKQKADSIIKTVDGVREMSLFKYFGLVNLIVANSNEGHFGVGNWEDEVHNGFGNNTYKYLPLSVEVLDNQVFVVKAFSNEGVLNRGDEILRINGKSSSEIISEMSAYVSSDGHIKANVEKTLSLSFPWKYYLFMEQPEVFQITYKTSGSQAKETAKISAITREEMVKNYQQRYANEKVEKAAEGKDKVYEFEIEDDMAVLTLKSFNRSLVEDNKLKAKKFYKEIFEELEDKAVSHLIVDVRGNTGGRNEFAFEILPFIQKRQSDGVVKTSYSWSGKKREYKIPSKKKLAFSGDVYVLVNGSTFSAGSTVARYLKEYADATVIGEEGGGRYEGFAGGSSEAVYLPNSKLRILIPRYLIEFAPSSKQPTKNRGILPDYEIGYTIQEILDKENKELEFAKQLINKRTTQNK